MGYLPLWTAWHRETHTMIGNPSMPATADALAERMPCIDADAALQAMLDGCELLRTAVQHLLLAAGGTLRLGPM